jgi:polyhydroxybutyrate depolymerase
MKFFYSLIFTLFIFSSICFGQSTLSKTMMHGGILRDYRLYIPASYSSSTSVPLVFNLHGYTSNNSQQEYYGDFRGIADTANFILVHPNGTFDGSGNRYWNAYTTSGVDDEGFLSALIDTLSNSYSIDLNRVYFTGMSNGGIMSYYMACRRSNKVAAIASVTGSMTAAMKSACNAQHPMPVMEIHGTADATVVYNGNGTFIPIDSVVKFWVDFNNCNTTPVMNAVPNSNTTDGCTADQFIYSGGEAGSSVELFKVNGGGHSWPGAPVNLNVTNMDFSASKEIWRFFRKYRLNNLTSVKNETSKVISVYPNPATDFIHIESGHTIKSIELFDVTGRKLHAVISIDETKAKMNCEQIPSGYYLLKVYAEGSVQTFRLAKQ